MSGMGRAYAEECGAGISFGSEAGGWAAGIGQPAAETLASNCGTRRRQRRKAALSRFKPAPSITAWAVLLAISVVGYFWSGASSRFEKAPPSGVSD